MESPESQIQLLDLIAEHTADLIAVIDPEGRRVWNNRAYYAVLGYSPKDIQGTDSLLEIHPDDKTLVGNTFTNSMRSGVGRRIEYRMRHRDGRWIHLESEARVVRDWNGMEKCLILIARDITARTEAEEALARTQARLLAELEEAAAYVRSILPAPLVAGAVRCDWRFTPSEELGGDAFGYHWIDDEHFALYLLDAAGHGVRAALLSVSAMNSLRTQSLPRCDFLDPASVLSAMNRDYQMEEHGEMFFTLWYGVVHAPSRTIRYASAGHPPALVLAPGAPRPVPLESRGLMIGAMPEAEYVARKARMEAGSALYLYSDGAFEIRDCTGKSWTTEDFVALLSTLAGVGETDLDPLVRELCRANGGTRFDDDFSILRFVFP